jgi:hypothetical protein
MLRASLWILLLLVPPCVQAQGLVVDAEVMEGSSDVELPGAAHVRYAILHHKHQRDQASLAQWLRHHKDAHVSFQTRDGTSHAAVLQRLKDCFGRGLLLYSDPVQLAAKETIRLSLGASD